METIEAKNFEWRVRGTASPLHVGRKFLPCVGPHRDLSILSRFSVLMHQYSSAGWRVTFESRIAAQAPHVQCVAMRGCSNLFCVGRATSWRPCKTGAQEPSLSLRFYWCGFAWSVLLRVHGRLECPLIYVECCCRNHQRIIGGCVVWSEVLIRCWMWASSCTCYVQGDTDSAFENRPVNVLLPGLWICASDRQAHVTRGDIWLCSPMQALISQLALPGMPHNNLY